MAIRYIGSDDARDVALDGGFVSCPRGIAVDLVAAAKEAGLDPEYAAAVEERIVEQDSWESVAKPKRKAKDQADTPVEQAEKPAETVDAPHEQDAATGASEA